MVWAEIDHYWAFREYKPRHERQLPGSLSIRAIGQALCEELAKLGAMLVAWGRVPERRAAVAERTGAEKLDADARDASMIASCVALAVVPYGRLDGAVILVGSLPLKPVHLVPAQGHHL
jgi:NAD(P)-dependent dehydrogenase (short-subunit alcohol dehydrogenase family)